MSLDPIDLRNAFGQFATGVTVITAEDSNGRPFGMTVNSFSSLSLDPPMLLWSIQNNSDCFSVFDNVGQFGVNILSQDQQGLSGRFARKGEHEMTTEELQAGENGCPLLKGAMTQFECTLDAQYPGGDHTILVGRIDAIQSDAEQTPLVFFGGAYRELKETP